MQNLLTPMLSFGVGFRLFCLINIVYGQTEIQPPTNATSTDEFYVTSVGSHFQFDIINCGTTNCHILCGEANACFSIQVDASSADTLTIQCLADSSCEELSVIGPSTTLNMYCEGVQSCETGKIYADKTTNVNIACNYSATTSATDGTCYNLFLNASQSSSVSIDCFGQYSCATSDIYVNNAASVSIHTEGLYALLSSNLFANEMTNQLDILCNGAQSCASMSIYANSMTNDVLLSCNGAQSCSNANLLANYMTGMATVICNGDSGCNNIYIACPIIDVPNICNIDCVAANSCNNAQFIIPHNQYNGLNLFCNTIDTSCVNADFHCGISSTQLSYDVTNNYFKCDNYECCPVYEGNITCSPGSNCHIDCSSTMCRNHYINATQANSLHLECGGLGCSGSKILCPTDDYTVCNISSGTTALSLSYTTIESGNNNIMDTFILDCASTEACKYAAVSLHCTSINDVYIESSGSYSMRDSVLDLQSDILNSFTLSCLSSTSCHYMDIAISSPFIDSLVWQCPASSSCTSTMTLPSNTNINSYQLLCGSGACTSVVLNAANSSINNLTIDCVYCRSLDIDATVTDLTMDCVDCRGMDIDVEIRNNADINCIAVASCNAVSVDLISTQPNTNINIMCSNPLKTTASANGACYYSNWNIYGHFGLNGVQSDSLTVYCSQYDCNSANFYGSNLLAATVDCDDKFSCSSATVNFGEVTALDLRCTNTSACASANVYCPYRYENACSIDCCQDCGDVNTCNAMKIYVPDGYTYGYLHVSCPSAQIFPNSDGCVNLNVNCQDGQKSTVYYVYNMTLHDYECQYGGIAYCCPYYKGSKIVCNPGDDCSIDCAVMSSQGSSCSNTFIDGTDSNVLNVDCVDSECADSLIHCPAGGCNITCKGYYSCNGAQIVYNGELSDYGRVSINCTDYYACQNLIIDARYADRVDIDCNTMDYEQNYVCYQSTLNAQYAKKVNLAFRDEYCSSGSNWNVNNAQTVTLSAFGSYAFYNSYLRAENAGFLSVVCSSDSGTVACYSNTWYIPYNTEFNCYGDGCYQLTNIYSYPAPNDVNGALFLNMYSCGQCTSFTDCIYDFSLYCNAGSNVDHFYGDDYSGYDGCYSDDCGCNKVVNNAQFAFSVTDGNCYSPLQAKTCTSVSGQDCVVNCDYNNGDCINSVIDVADSSYLTVNCMYSNYCENVLIQCPTDGCFINCNSSAVCSNAHILYPYSANIFINCEGANSCNNMIIDAQYADTIDIYCKAAKNDYSGVCYQMVLNAQNAGNVFLNFLNEYASSSSTFNVENVGNLVLGSFGTESFYASTIHAEYAQSVQLNCGSETDTSGCYSSSYYVPYNTELNCFGDGCYQIGAIYLNTNATGLRITSMGCDKCQSLSECIYSFTLYCNVLGYQQSSTCYGSSTSYDYYDYCQCYKVMNSSIYDNSAQDSRCYASVGAVDGLGCTDGENCAVACDYYGKCADGFIDGSNYNYLTVQCQGANYCEYSRILCPANGCSIECKSEYACYYAEIIYTYENYENWHGHVKVECVGSESCNNMKIIANTAYSVSLSCKSTENNFQYVCNYLSLNATNSYKVSIVGNHEYGIANSHIYANNASNVELDARGSYGFWTSYFYANHAKSVSIKCVAEYSAACSDSHWFLATDDTTFNCYGAGCNGLGSLYIAETAENITFNLNSCKDCDDKESCLGSLTIYCKGNSLIEYYYGYTYDAFNDNECYSPYQVYGYDTCGCNEFIKSVSYEEDSSDSNCYASTLSTGEIVAIVVGVAGGVIGCILICVLYRYCQKRKRKAKYTPASNNINYTSGQPVVVNPVAAPVVVTRYAAQPIVMKPTPMFIRPQPALSAVGSVSAVSSNASYGTTNDVQLANDVKLLQMMLNAGPSAPSMETPIPGAPSAPSAPSAPGNYEDAPPSYNSVEMGAQPPAYFDVMPSAKQYVATEGEGGVTNM